MNSDRIKQYYEIFTDVWKLFRHHSDLDESTEFWSNYVKAVGELDKKYKESDFFRSLVLAVTKELERIEKQER